MGCQAIFTHLYRTMREKMGLTEEDDVEDPDVRCTFCTRKERVRSLDSLQPGDHICMGGQHLMKNLGYRQVTFYTHHAIVKAVDQIDHTNYAIELVHFYSTSFDEAIRIRETTEMVNLNTYEIYKICYAHKTHSAEKIVMRAVSLARSDNTTYSLATCNCEHFCHWCCVGNGDSYQVNDVYTIVMQIATGTLNIGGKVLKVVARVLMVSLDDVAKAGTKAFIAVPWGILGFFALAYLVYCIYRHCSLNSDLSQGKICLRCCAREKVDLWLKFFIYCSTQTGGIGLISLVMGAGVCTGVLAGCVTLCALLTILLMWGIPKLRSKLSCPFKGRMIKVEQTRQLMIADVISFKYRGIMHNGIVSGIKSISSTKAVVTIIHYSSPLSFGCSTVEEIEVNFDLTCDKVKSHDFTGYNVYPPELVLQRARQRLGEQKYGLMSNRSCHFCHWAKVKQMEEVIQPTGTDPSILYERELRQGEDISGLKQINVDHRRGKKHSTKVMESTWARIPEDVQPGEVVRFNYSFTRRRHFAIVTGVHHSEEPSPILSMTVVHYGRNYKLCEETLEFDLRSVDVWIYKYHPVHRFSRDEVIRRARARIDNFQVVYQRSWDMVEEIVPKNVDQRITTFDEVDPGDVIVFYYWSLKHAAVVTMIGTSSDKANTVALVGIIHYALDNLFATRTVKEEFFLMDLRKETVYRRSYDAYVTYQPHIVIRRARSRLNEQRFSPHGNTSWDLVHWAKVIQNPSLMKRTVSDLDIGYKADKKAVLLPKTGKQYDRFQRLQVLAWRDLQPGMILDYKYYMIWHQGIVSDVDVKRSKVSVIHYGTDTLFSRRTIMEDTFSINLRKDKLWMYKCDPNVANTPELTVALARERLGECKWGQNNKSWDFCKACILKTSRSSAALC